MSKMMPITSKNLLLLLMGDLLQNMKMRHNNIDSIIKTLVMRGLTLNRNNMFVRFFDVHMSNVF